jgi:Alcohol acetyltransferase
VSEVAGPNLCCGNLISGHLGNLEKIFTARHSLGFYRAVAVTATYSCPEPLGELEHIVWRALREVVPRHPVLCCGIINEDTKDPAFIRLKAIDLRQNVTLKSEEANADEGLVNCLEEEHSKLWPDLRSRPGWRLILLNARRNENSKGTQIGQPAAQAPHVALDAVFVWHHALCDGLSGVAFHRSLLEELRRVSRQNLPFNRSPLIQIPDTLRLSPPIEKLMRFPLTWTFIGQQLWNYFVPPWLLGEPPVCNPKWINVGVASTSMGNYKSRMRLISLPAEAVVHLLLACRKAKVTLTALLQGVVGASLIELGATGFTAQTPYSMRKFVGTLSSEMVNQVSMFNIDYDNHFIANVTRNTPDTELVWEIARHMRDRMEEEMARAPTDNFIGMLPYLSDYHGFLRKKLGKHNGTFEISNLGIFKRNTGEQASRNDEWEIERVVFSQSAMAAGAALGFNCISMENGPLTISITWLDGIVEDLQLETLVSKVEARLKSLEA